jgi:hypothetical protein
MFVLSNLTECKVLRAVRPETGEDLQVFELRHPFRGKKGKFETVILSNHKKGRYFLLKPAAISSTAPIAAMAVAIPTGDFCVIPAAGGAAVTAAL